MKTIAILIATLALVSNAYAANKECKPGSDLEYKCAKRDPIRDHPTFDKTNPKDAKAAKEAEEKK